MTDDEQRGSEYAAWGNWRCGVAGHAVPFLRLRSPVSNTTNLRKFAGVDGFASSATLSPGRIDLAPYPTVGEAHWMPVALFGRTDLARTTSETISAAAREEVRPFDVLFVANTHIGDAVMASGLIKHLFDTIPNVRFTLAAGGPAAPLFAQVPNLERLIVIRKKRRRSH